MRLSHSLQHRGSFQVGRWLKRSAGERLWNQAERGRKKTF